MTSAQFRCSVSCETASIQYSVVTAPGGDLALRELLAEHGYAVVEGCLDHEELTELESEWNRDISSLIDHRRLDDHPKLREAYERFEREGSSSLPVATAHMLAHPQAGFVLGRGLAHGGFAWMARSHRKVRKVFELIWGTEQLVTSCDVPFFSPATAPEAEVATLSAHVDQNQSDVRGAISECPCFQGVLYVWDSMLSHSSNTVLWPESHKKVWPELMTDEAMKQLGRDGQHYSQITDVADSQLREALVESFRAEAFRVPVSAGGLLLWNSRTVHQGWNGGPRLAQTVCWEPRAHCTDPERVRLQKLRLACLGLPSTHWASVGQQHDMTLDCGPDEEVSGEVTSDGQVVLPLRARARQPYLACESSASVSDDSGVSNLIQEELSSTNLSLCGSFWDVERVKPEVKSWLESQIKSQLRNILS